MLAPEPGAGSCCRRELPTQQRPVGQREKNPGEREKVDHVPQVDHTPAHALEVREHADPGRGRTEQRRQAHDERVEAQEDQQEHHAGRQDEGGDLAPGEARGPDSDPGEPGGQEGGP